MKLLASLHFRIVLRFPEHYRLLSRYVRILGAFYLRLTGTDIDVYRYLEPLYNDYRKLRRKLGDGSKPFVLELCLSELRSAISWYTDVSCYIFL